VPRYRLSLLSYDSSERLRYYPDAILGIDSAGRINEVTALKGRRPKGLRGALDRRGLLAVPGLIDAHAHVSQYPAVAADGLELLPWLKKHVFPLEEKFRGQRARATARRFFKDAAAHGVSTTCLYTSIWKDSTDVTFQEAQASGMRAIIGKVMMDRGSYNMRFPKMYPGKSRTEVSLRESEALCRKWHHAAGGRLLYAFTPRFALSTTQKLMEQTAQLADEYGAYIQTHLAENHDELKEAARLFPKARNYTDVYAQAGLLGPRTLLAHTIWLGKSEYKSLAASGAAVVHCPTSNAFLTSGIMDAGRMRRLGIPLALGSDVAGGPTLCPFEVMRQAVYGQRLAGAHRIFKKPPQPTAAKAFFIATLGAARALRLSGRIGSLEVGKDADITVLDPQSYDVSEDARPSAEAVAARMVFRASRAAVRATLVQGKRVHGKL
jgi:guanine deaminase